MTTAVQKTFVPPVVEASSEDIYPLARDNDEARRLNEQHNALLHFTRGELLHPEIVDQLRRMSGDEKRLLLMADIATGTAIWPRHLLEALATENITAEIHGFDITRALFPSAKTLPGNIHLHVKSILEPPEDRWKGKFDYVHVRLLIGALKAEEWRPAIQNCAEMLKPGGILDWEEMNMGAVVSDPYNEAIEEMFRYTRIFFKKAGRNHLPCNRFPAHFESAGLKLTPESPYTYDVRVVDKSVRDVFTGGSISALKRIAEQGAVLLDEDTGYKSAEQVLAMGARAEEAFAKGGVQITWPLHRFVGQKVTTKDATRLAFIQNNKQGCLGQRKCFRL